MYYYIYVTLFYMYYIECIYLSIYPRLGYRIFLPPRGKFATVSNPYFRTTWSRCLHPLTAVNYTLLCFCGVSRPLASLFLVLLPSDISCFLILWLQRKSSNLESTKCCPRSLLPMVWTADTIEWSSEILDWLARELYNEIILVEFHNLEYIHNDAHRSPNTS